MIFAGLKMRLSTLSIILHSIPTGLAFSPKRLNWICVISGENSAIDLRRKDTDRHWDNNWLFGLGRQTHYASSRSSRRRRNLCSAGWWVRASARSKEARAALARPSRWSRSARAAWA
jgi:hypothetical protein